MIPARKVPEKIVYADGEAPEALHDKPFKPSNPNKKGQPGYIAKFPEYLPNPPTELKRVIKTEDDPDPPPGWKATYRGKTRPQPGIACNVRNLKS
tara:strand:- start:126 stop:410 length:285 start_codon:yes stop_codon:yes gene_type:complete